MSAKTVGLLAILSFGLALSASAQIVCPPPALGMILLEPELEELAPLYIRGKELQRYQIYSGTVSLLVVEYENVTISEAFQGRNRIGVTVTFKN
jgi:hypothetical protein